MSIVTMVSDPRRQPMNRLAAAARLRRPRVTRSVGRICRKLPVAGINRDIHAKFASTRDEWQQAFQLVADQYQARGYEESGGDCRFTTYHALPDTVVLIAKAQASVVATLSLVMDNTLLGMPMESLYAREVQGLRRQGRRIGEVSSLADKGLTPREFVAVFISLIQMAWQYHVRHGGDTGVITVNPRHSAFYTRVLGFLPLGPRRAYDKVQGHPAEAFYLTPDLMAARVPGMHQRMFGQSLPAEALVAPALPRHLAYYFAARSTQTRLGAVEQVLWNTQACGSLRRW